ncbi:hypothetical protein FraEuI1c_4745 [Pseudofrankia inefficax]|uniref:Uncharacterized protein n=2 Tax=Pseudofrankia inefficax (strain DSM 45817 / CECT 9037 / DDB 130130 / EuI1c) TaxID=298654 RepID=E3IZG6_PSEI1|nr:hypothetical protein [Pseudofrankia inefficax]ADP82736.1 hypothetical protein FraEuI1c_4745 [Pseudofrankia inefficax]
MPDSAVLQVLIGLALVFAVFSVAVSRMNETVLGFLNYRGRQLEAELRRLTSENVERDPALPVEPVAAPAGAVRDLTAEMLDGPLRGLRTGGRPSVPAVGATALASGWWQRVRRAQRLRLPAYLPSTEFARAVLDLVEPAPRALLARVSPQDMAKVFDATVTDEQRAAYADAYRAAYAGLTRDTARALQAALPAGYESGLAVTTAMIALLPLAGPADEPAGATVPADASTAPAPMLPLSAEIALLPESSLKTALIGIAARAGADRDKLLAELAGWYDSSMDRLSGWYKRRVSRFLLVYALVLTVVFNLDTISLTRALWQDSAVRTAAVATAESRVSAPNDPSTAGGEGAVEAVRDIGALQIPFGWTRSHAASDPRTLPNDAGGWALKVLGWLIAVAALAAGAPFWFDLLGRLVNMRSTGPKPKPADG